MAHDEPEYEKRARAGLVPYIIEDGIIKVLTMVASNPLYGGPRPMLSKGKIEDGEDSKTAAVREAVEELGLIEDNIVGGVWLLADQRVELRSGAYNLSLYAARIMDRYDFDKWQDETEYTTWLTLEEFREQASGPCQVC
jgi:8-oxo-dGTP pyrophosphatase MutT (NUDIX family)